jgi:hypothetical protein
MEKLAWQGDSCALKHLLRCRWDLCSSGIFHSVEWQYSTDVLRQPISPIFMGQVTLEYGSHWLSQNTPTESHPILQNIPEEYRSQGASLFGLICSFFFNLFMTRPVTNNPQYMCVFLACPLGQLQIYLYLVGSFFYAMAAYTHLICLNAWTPDFSHIKQVYDVNPPCSVSVSAG